MADSEHQASVEACARTTYVIWVAMLLTLVVYAVVAMVIRRPEEPSSLPDALTRTSHWTALVLALLLLIVSHLLAGVLGPRVPTAAGAVSGGLAEQCHRLQTAAVVVSALAEVQAIVGLVVFFLGLSFSRFLVFIALAVALQVVNLYRIQRWIADLQRTGDPYLTS